MRQRLKRVVILFDAREPAPPPQGGLLRPRTGQRERTRPEVRPVGLAAEAESTTPARCAVSRLRLGVAVLIPIFALLQRRSLQPRTWLRRLIE